MPTRPPESGQARLAWFRALEDALREDALATAQRLTAAGWGQDIDAALAQLGGWLADAAARGVEVARLEMLFAA